MMHLGSTLPQWDIPRSGLEALYKCIKSKSMSQVQGPYLSNSNKYLIFRTLSTSTRVFLASSSACCSSNPLILVPIVFEYTSSPSHVDCSLTLLTSRFHGFEHTTAALSSQFSPSSPRYYRGAVVRRDPHNAFLPIVRTLTRIFAPNENPSPNNGLLGNFSLSHFTTCLISHVARALYRTPVVILLPAQPRLFTTQASHFPESTSGRSTCRRYISCDPPLNPCSVTTIGRSSIDPILSTSSSVKYVVLGGKLASIISS